MRFEKSLTIRKPVSEVYALYTDRKELSQWQPDFTNSRQIESYPLPKYTHQIPLGRRKMKMTETILLQHRPDRCDIQYELKGVKQIIHNTFYERVPGETQWQCQTEYRFTGIMKIISFFMRGNFRTQTDMMMQNFKGYAESR